MTLERDIGCGKALSCWGSVIQDEEFGFSSNGTRVAVLTVKNGEGYEEKEIGSWGQSDQWI